jgi:tetratricopeptide (TPR) repeat protein
VTLDPDSHRNNKTFTALLRRETIILIVLAAATVPLFLFTRSMAAWNRQTNIVAGRVWYERARKSIEEGASDTALDYLRKAATSDRDNMDYSLALAEALDAGGQSDEARQILVRLRDLRPEDGRINLDLARLSVKSDEIDAARRYYHQALYGMWPTGRLEVVSGTIRMELIRFLVSHHDTSSAVSELLILDANSPGDAAARMELGNLFLQADEPGRALNQFLGVLKLEPMNAAALAGAGEAQFKLGNDEAAKRQLQDAAEQGPLPSDAQHALDLASLVLSSDPLANGIGARERAQRLTLALGIAANRLEACSTQGAIPDPTAAEMLKIELAHTKQQVSGDSAGTELNLLRDGLKIASRAVLTATDDCKPASDAEHAIVLSAERHKVNTP